MNQGFFKSKGAKLFAKFAKKYKVLFCFLALASYFRIPTVRAFLDENENKNSLSPGGGEGRGEG